LEGENQTFGPHKLLLRKRGGRGEERGLFHGEEFSPRYESLFLQKKRRKVTAHLLVWVGGGKT